MSHAKPHKFQRFSNLDAFFPVAIAIGGMDKARFEGQSHLFIIHFVYGTNILFLLQLSTASTM